MIRPVKQNKPCWIKLDGISPAVDWAPRGTPIRCEAGEGFDLKREPGLRFWVRVDAERTDITIQVHHACTDGTGVYRFLGDLLAAYGQLTSVNGEFPAFGELDARLLRGRRTRIAEVAVSDSRTRFITSGLAEAWKVFGHRITPLHPPQRPDFGRALTDFPGFETITFSQDEHKRLRAAAAAHGAMLNDLLLAHMLCVMRAWNRQHGTSHRDGRLRIMMPSDLREKQDYLMPAANMTAYTFITRHQRDCNHPYPELIRSVRDETLRIKNRRLGTKFVDALMLAEHSPAVLRFLLGLKRCSATAILSNIGDPTKRFTSHLPRHQGKIISGNLVLEDIVGVPPMRASTHATLAVFSYLRRLTLCLRCNPYAFAPADTRAFLQVYADSIRRHLVVPSHVGSRYRTNRESARSLGTTPVALAHNCVERLVEAEAALTCRVGRLSPAGHVMGPATTVRHGDVGAAQICNRRPHSGGGRRSTSARKSAVARPLQATRVRR